MSLAGFRIEGHAIVSADDRIADATGVMPPQLRNESDWRRFQVALDAAAVVVLGRRSHEVTPNPRKRNRMVVSSSSGGIERRDDGWWWNPDAVPFATAVTLTAPRGGIVAVPGGRLVFDLFLRIGFDAFHLSRATRVYLPGGVPVFSDITTKGDADAVVAATGLRPQAPEIIDESGDVTLVTWIRPQA